MKGWPVGVAARLLLAFIGISLFSLLAAATALLAFRDVGALVDSISERELPAGIAALELSGQAARIAARGPSLLAASTPEMLNSVSASIGQELETLEATLAGVRDNKLLPDATDSIGNTVSWLGIHYRTLDALAASRMKMASRRGAMVDELGRVDRHFRSLRDSLSRSATAPSAGIVGDDLGLDSVHRELAGLSALLVLGLWTETGPDGELVQARIEGAWRSMKEALQRLDDDPARVVRGVLERVAPFVSGPSRATELRREEQQGIVIGQRVLRDNAAAIRALEDVAAQLLAAARREVEARAIAIAQRQRSGVTILVLVVCLSIASSAGLFWLYVWRGLLRRLRALSDATLALAGGNLGIAIAADADDEIGRMTLALSNFRDTALKMRESEATLERNQFDLRRLASELSLTEERERRRIATELHDGAVQDLALTRIKLGGVINRPADANAGTSLAEIRELLDQSIRQVRSLMSELSPPTLYELGLLPALGWLVEQFRVRYDLDCKLVADSGHTSLDKNLDVLVFQSVRELLMNVMKHAGAQHVEVRAQQQSGWLRVTVADDGCGIAGSSLQGMPSELGGFGLFNMRERLRLQGGGVQIESSGGTCVTIAVPVSSE